MIAEAVLLPAAAVDADAVAVNAGAAPACSVVDTADTGSLLSLLPGSVSNDSPSSGYTKRLEITTSLWNDSPCGSTFDSVTSGTLLLY